MKKKRILIWLLIICLLFAGCNESTTELQNYDTSAVESQLTDNEQEKPDPSDTVYRFYYDSGDSFHPFLAKTQTQYNLFSLLYDGLVKISPEYTVEYKIARSVRISGKECRIQLADTVFSDGTAVTAEDVIYSFEQAKQEGSLYAAQLADAESCTEEDGDIVITLKNYNRFFAYDLDFPIIKKSSGNSDLPIGRGRYILLKSGNSYSMVQNENYGLKSVLPDIELTVLKSNDSMLYAVKTGSITAYLENSGEGTVATIGTWTASVSLNHLVFMGINPENSILSNSLVRKAILLAIDSNAILTQAYGSQGVIAAAPVNPRLTDAMEYDFSTQDLYNTEQSKALLEEAGYYVTDSSVRENRSGRQLKVSILVNKNNSARYSAAYLISSMLESVGFSTEIERVSFDEYSERIESGDFDLYIGETSQTLDSDLDIFLTGTASYGIGNDSDLSFSAAASAFLKSAKGENAFFDSVFEEVPMIPLLYRNGLIIYSKSIENKVITAPHDIFYNIEDWL